MASSHPGGLTERQFRTLGQSAVDAKANAYCPYSSFRVGAAFLTSSSTIITGANIENASYPVGTCAERVALAKAVTDGHRGFRALAVATDITPPASPCGMCRQFMREFCTLDMPVFMFDGEGAYVVKTLGELLPMSFGPEDLKGGGKGEGGLGGKKGGGGGEGGP
ncbi:MAG: hypothetical protein LQ344_005657 [Seirophora lacunosa]|nr:MAG: hypothetical protein LQ344_005657 [Seirophora lacunosa]